MFITNESMKCPDFRRSIDQIEEDLFNEASNRYLKKHNSFANRSKKVLKRKDRTKINSLKEKSGPAVNAENQLAIQTPKAAPRTFRIDNMDGIPRCRRRWGTIKHIIFLILIFKLIFVYRLLFHDPWMSDQEGMHGNAEVLSTTWIAHTLHPKDV